MKDKIGFVGLGAMGGKMVPHLLKGGYEVFVCDSQVEAVASAVMGGAARCESPRHVADHADIVLACLPTPDVVEQVALGKAGIAEGKRVRIFVDHSTTGPSMARSLALRLAEHGIAALDAPLAGGVAGADAGTLSVMVGGDRAAFERCEPAFKSFGRKVVHVGTEPGAGQTLKLVNNMIVGATLIATSEAVLFGLKSGLDARVLLDMINASTARSFTSETLVAKAVLSRRFDFGFRMDLMRKDVRLFLAEAEQVGVSTFMASVTKQFFDRSIAQGYGGDDMTQVVRELEQLAGVQIAAAAA
ncbi:NAD(P)-dependent oxidoreductase [Aromatoleum bremense]|uniref:NAD-binding protein n=1 Tax=Aromatoleum bremense TaxID=76115 RepID=A0ABX1P1F7_9RHOO|nr:NAD(P)-dependent oxidoreductase [Aromatoleum bremense]NMG17540.1 NAD-binding protein [Aromatoleum bremense]QTQ30279.1 NAD(P)-binding domain-containing protein [Aromatoleum bremense]